MNTKLILIPLLGMLTMAGSCREAVREDDAAGKALQYPARITVEEPFAGQPNEFCTVIRMVAGYEIGEETDKACLLDVCLGDDESSPLAINLGDAEQPVMAAYTLAHVFESPEAALAYGLTHGIVDVQLP